MTRETTIGTSEKTTAWICDSCTWQFILISVVTGKDEYGFSIDNLWPWGNPELPPFCPKCGKQIAKEARDENEAHQRTTL